MKASFHKKLNDTALEHETDLVVVGRFAEHVDVCDHLRLMISLKTLPQKVLFLWELFRQPCQRYSC